MKWSIVFPFRLQRSPTNLSIWGTIEESHDGFCQFAPVPGGPGKL